MFGIYANQLNWLRQALFDLNRKALYHLDDLGICYIVIFLQ